LAETIVQHKRAYYAGKPEITDAAFDRLADDLRLLRQRHSDAPERHRSLDAAIAWSYELLDTDERRMLAWSAVFVGGFEMAAAESAGAAAGIVMPLVGQRQALEQQTPNLGEARAVVDAGLAPWGAAWLLGQISLVNPLGQFDPEPDPAWMEARLRSCLARVWPQLAWLPATYQQMPVSFTASGLPLVGSVADAPGLWVCAGLGAPFAALPPLLETRADQLAAGSGS
jgi:glycine/D-amino acid oxidase-like deaminating enzyme